MKRIALPLMILSLVILSACSKDHEGLPTGFEFDPPPTPTDFEAQAGIESVTLSWSYPPESLGSLQEFRVYYYYSIYNMIELIGTTADTQFDDTKLIANVEYCYRVSAVDTNGLEGWRTGSRCATPSSSAR